MWEGAEMCRSRREIVSALAFQLFERRELRSAHTSTILCSVLLCSYLATSLTHTHTIHVDVCNDPLSVQISLESERDKIVMEQAGAVELNHETRNNLINCQKIVS